MAHAKHLPIEWVWVDLNGVAHWAQQAWQANYSVEQAVQWAIAQGACPENVHTASWHSVEPATTEWMLSVWAKPAHPQQLLQPGDRLECTAPLLIDPLTARRLRLARQVQHEQRKKQPRRRPRPSYK